MTRDELLAEMADPARDEAVHCLARIILSRTLDCIRYGDAISEPAPSYGWLPEDWAQPSALVVCGPRAGEGA